MVVQAIFLIVKSGFLFVFNIHQIFILFLKFDHLLLFFPKKKYLLNEYLLLFVDIEFPSLFLFELDILVVPDLFIHVLNRWHFILLGLFQFFLSIVFWIRKKLGLLICDTLLQLVISLFLVLHLLEHIRLFFVPEISSRYVIIIIMSFIDTSKSTFDIFWGSVRFWLNLWWIVWFYVFPRFLKL